MASSATSKSLPLRPAIGTARDIETSETAVILLLDLSPAALAGIDLLSFTTSPKFQGIKNLPQGFHFVFCSTTSDLSIRHGAWFHIDADSSPTLLVKRWNAASEHLEAVDDQVTLMRWRANLGSIWKEGLSPYRQSSAQETPEETNDWKLMVEFIKAPLLSRLVGSVPNHWYLTSASSANQDLEAIPGLVDDGDTSLTEKELGFLPIDLSKPWREGATGRERTEAARDHSWYLRHLIEEHCIDCDASHILGEMQFCFIMILTLNNYSCLEQWKRLMKLVLTCQTAAADLSAFFVKFLSILRLQLQHCQDAEGGLFDLADESGSLLKQLLHRFKLGLKDISGMGKSDVMDEFDELEAFLRAEYGWEIGSNVVRKGLLELEDGEQVDMDITGYDEEDESGEYAPAIVELTKKQMEALGITSAELKASGLTMNALKQQEQDLESEDDQELEDMDERY